MGRRSRRREVERQEAPAGPEEASATSQEAPAEAAVAAPAEAEGGWARWGRGAFIVAYLALQLGLPLRYYLDQDPYDERFAWRMFSAVRMTPCQLAVAERVDGGAWSQPRLNEQVHVVWIELMTRGRRDVLRAYARSRCEVLGASGGRPEVRISLSCALPDGSVDRPVDPEANLCEAEIP